MGKSLTDTAKAILMKEDAIPSVSPMDAGHPDRQAKAMNPNMATLRPNSRSAEGRFATPGSTPPGGAEAAEDLGPALVNNTDIPPSAKAAGKMGKDSSRSSVSAVPAEKPRKQEEIMEEDQIDEVRRYPEGRMERAKKAYGKASDEAQGMPLGDWKTTPGAKKPGLRGLLGQRDPSKREFVPNSTGKKYFKASERLGKLETKSMAEETLDEEIEISEELEAFIEAMLEEGYSEEQIAEAIEENFEIVEAKHEKEDEDEADEKDEDEKEDEKEDKKKMMKEHIDALLSGENLSEDFRERAEVIFESAVSVRLQEEVAVLEDAYAEALEEEVAKIRAELTEQVDDYLNYVVEQWVADNEVAIESGLRSELTEDFISGLRSLFAEHYIDIPEDKVSIVEELGSKVEALETKLNEEIDRNVSLTKMINESKQFEILVSACDGLTTTQAEKLHALAENVAFTSPEEFAAKVQTLKESYFPTTVRADAVLDKVEPSEDSGKLMTEELTGPMAAYVRTLGKTVK